MDTGMRDHLWQNKQNWGALFKSLLQIDKVNGGNGVAGGQEAKTSIQNLWEKNSVARTASIAVATAGDGIINKSLRMKTAIGRCSTSTAAFGGDKVISGRVAKSSAKNASKKDTAARAKITAKAGVPSVIALPSPNQHHASTRTSRDYTAMSYSQLKNLRSLRSLSPEQRAAIIAAARLAKVNNKPSAARVPLKTRYCGKYSPAKGMPTPIPGENTNRGPGKKFKCISCLGGFKDTRGVFKHFPKCIKNFGNPLSRYWYDHRSVKIDEISLALCE